MAPLAREAARRASLAGGFGFAGTITNVTRPDLNHLNIDKAEDLHKQTIAEIAILLASKG